MKPGQIVTWEMRGGLLASGEIVGPAEPPTWYDAPPEGWWHVRRGREGELDRTVVLIHQSQLS